jgi:ubiquinone/menaquinone biosynthesis C-methylase UbiE
VERTLQHVADPGLVLAEMARATRPGGRVLALEPDWGTFIVDSGERQVARSVTELWCDSFRSGWVGRALPRLMARAGLAVTAIEPRSLVSRSLAEAEAVYNLLASLKRAVAAGNVSEAAAEAFRDEQRRLDAAGRFFACLTFFLVVGVKA